VKRLKKILRIAGLVFMILLASFGVGIMGAILPEQKAPMKKEDTIEMVDENNGDEVK